MDAKFKNEAENTRPLKEQVAELELAQKEIEIKITELQLAINSIQAQNRALQQEIGDLQAFLKKENNMHSQFKEFQNESENKKQILIKDLEQAMVCAQQSCDENLMLSKKISDSDKVKACLDFKLKATQDKYEEESEAGQELSLQEAIVQQTILNEEESPCTTSDENPQAQERKLNILSMIYRRIQQRLHKFKKENRQETEKILALQSLLEKECDKNNNLLLEISQHNSVATALREAEKKFEDDIAQLKNEHKQGIGLKHELQNKLESEQYFSRLYKAQADEYREENKELCREIQDLKKELVTMRHEVEVAVALADSEAFARSIADKTLVDIEKEIIMKDLELKDLNEKLFNCIFAKEATIRAVKEIIADFIKKLTQSRAKNDELLQMHKNIKKK